MINLSSNKCQQSFRMENLEVIFRAILQLLQSPTHKIQKCMLCTSLGFPNINENRSVQGEADGSRVCWYSLHKACLLAQAPSSTHSCSRTPMLTTVTHFYVTHRSPAPLGNHGALLVQDSGGSWEFYLFLGTSFFELLKLDISPCPWPLHTNSNSLNKR